MKPLVIGGGDGGSSFPGIEQGRGVQRHVSRVWSWFVLGWDGGGGGVIYRYSGSIFVCWYRFLCIYISGFTLWLLFSLFCAGPLPNWPTGRLVLRTRDRDIYFVTL